MEKLCIFARAAANCLKLVDASYYSPGGRATRFVARRALLGARGGDGARRHRARPLKTKELETQAFGPAITFECYGAPVTVDAGNTLLCVG